MLVQHLDLMRREQEARQNYLHSSFLSWDVGMLKRIRWWMANLFVDCRTLEYSSKINYEGRKYCTFAFNSHDVVSTCSPVFVE